MPLRPAPEQHFQWPSPPISTHPLGGTRAFHDSTMSMQPATAVSGEAHASRLPHPARFAYRPAEHQNRTTWRRAGRESVMISGLLRGGWVVASGTPFQVGHGQKSATRSATVASGRLGCQTVSGPEESLPALIEDERVSLHSVNTANPTTASHRKPYSVP